MEYIIKHEPIKVEDKEISKYNIYYVGGDWDGQKEFYAYELDKPQTKIREGYTKHPDSL